MKDEWNIACDIATFTGLKNEEMFGQIIALARAVNALTFVHESSLRRKGTSPASRRARTNGFLFGCAVLQEALLLVQRMKRNYNAVPIFAAELLPLLRDKTALQILKAHLTPARNNVIFHFNSGALIERARQSNAGCAFVCGKGKKNYFRKYYEFADSLALEVLVGVSRADKDFSKTAEGAVTATIDLSVRFLNAADHLIASCLVNWGFGFYGIKDKLP